MIASPSSSAELLQQSFREEAREILADLESALLELHKAGGGADLVSRIFRGMHTLKGSGAMFGFDRMAAFTHDLETAFDKVRNGLLPVSPDLIDLSLAALDQIRTMLESESEGGDAAVCSGILASIRQLWGDERGAAAVHGEKAAAVVPEVTSGPARNWRIRFAPGPDLMRCGASPLLLLRELGELGGAEIEACVEGIPPLAEIDPEQCSVSWNIRLKTGAGLDAIRDVFLFVEDVCELAIEEEGAPAAEAGTVSGAEADAIARGLVESRNAGSGRRATDRQESAASLRIPAARLDQLVGLVGELVTVQARLSELSARREDPEIAQAAEEIERLSSALRENSMNLRMMPIRGTFERFRRLVHDLARELNKPVELAIEGADTELDKAVIDRLGDPLMHLIRNSMDHGIEPPEVRSARGKPEVATIRLAARHVGATIEIEVSDDGGGIDSGAVRRRAVERGMTAADASLSEQEVLAFLWEPGFSTAEAVTDLSGRGVGMDVVRRTVESLRGSIDLRSRPGLGTTIALRLPLTLAIIDGLLVEVGGGRYVLPLAATLECIELSGAQGEHAAGRMADVRGELVPYIRLRDHFGVKTAAPEREQIMVIESDAGRCGLMVDKVLGNCQTVIRSLGKLFREVQGVSGATVLGDGTVALILDPPRLVQDALRTRTRGARAHPPGAP
jgi:two-component system chemotaxis sensor kinase CheA